MSSLAFLQGISPTQESTWGLQQCSWILYQRSYQGSPIYIYTHTTHTHIYMCSVISCFSHVRLFATTWTVACQSSLSIGFPQARILEWVAMPLSRGCICICVCVYIYMHTHTHKYIYTHKYIHTHIYTHMYIPLVTVIW